MVNSTTGDLRVTNVINFYIQRLVGFFTGNDWTSKEVVELAVLNFIAKASNHEPAKLIQPEVQIEALKNVFGVS